MGGEQKQPLTVGIEATCGVDPGRIDEPGEGPPAAAGLRRELAHHPVGLVEEHQDQG
jgi:hypothetical protein